MGHNGNKKIQHSIPARKGKRIPKKENIQNGNFRDVRRVPQSADNARVDVSEKHIVFRFDCLDLEDDCPWPMFKMDEKKHRDVLLKLADFEKTTVKELRSPSYRAFTIYDDFSLCPNAEAVKRLGDKYETGATDAIARFRLSGQERLYGFLIDNEFHLVWWDPEHKIWPSEKKHT